MAPLPRNSVTDFIRDVAARGINAGSSLNLYVATLSADNTTLTIKKNGVVLFSKVIWQAGGPPAVAATDAGGVQNFDTVVVFGAEGNTSVGSAQSFLNNLT